MKGKVSRRSGETPPLYGIRKLSFWTRLEIVLVLYKKIKGDKKEKIRKIKRLTGLSRPIPASTSRTFEDAVSIAPKRLSSKRERRTSNEK